MDLDLWDVLFVGSLFLQNFKAALLLNHLSYRPEILTQCSPPVTCHLSRSFYKLVELVGGGSGINGANPV